MSKEANDMIDGTPQTDGHIPFWKHAYYLWERGDLMDGYMTSRIDDTHAYLYYAREQEKDARLCELLLDDRLLSHFYGRWYWKPMEQNHE